MSNTGKLYTNETSSGNLGNRNNSSHRKVDIPSTI